MKDPHQTEPRLRGHIVVTIAALLLAAGIVGAKTQGVFARPDDKRGITPTANAPAVATPQPRTATSPTTTDWYSAQLHIHGWSNHNGASQPGALQYHSLWADTAGLDVLWWSEHNPTFYQVDDTTIDLTQATIPAGGLNVSIPLPPGTPNWAAYDNVTELRASFAGNGQPSASLVNSQVRMAIASDGDAVFDTFRYRGLTTGGIPVQGLRFTRPLVSDPRLSFDASLCGDTTPNVYAEVRMGLSWHNNGGPAAQELVYRLVPASGQPSIVNSSTRVTVTVPLSTTHVEVPLLAHASRLQDGDDNAIQEIYLKVGARNSATACLQIGNFRFHSLQPLPPDLVQEHKRVAQRHQATYGVNELTSWEQFAEQRHLNPYLPSNAPLLPGASDIQVQNFVPLVHNVGGLVALNHPFGAGSGAPLPPADQETRVQALLDTLLPVNAWGLDMIEIYKTRAQVNMTYHLRLWDLLAVNNIPLCAVSASDAHGGPFWESHYMVTWIEAASLGQDDLLEGLRRCRVFFGDLSRYDGVLDLRLGSVPMGGTYPSHAGTAPLQLTVNPLPAGAQVKLVQYRWIPARDLSYIVDHQVVDPSQPVMVDVGEPSILRVEVWSADNQPLALSNRIYIASLQCDVTDNGQTDMADLQSVASAFGQAVPPASVAYDLQKNGQIDLWDVLVAAECWQNLHTR
jgi:hypothetical protein